MNSPRKKAPGQLGSKTGRKLIAVIQYCSLTFIANVFGAVFWFAEQRRWLLADRIENEELQP
jgi:hypothetical protein